MSKQLLNKIKQVKKDILDISEDIRADKLWGFEKDWETFTQGVSLLPPQVYGFRIQNRFKKELGMKDSSSLDKGDFSDNEKDFEFKCSLLSHESSLVNFVQIRPWQKVDYFFLILDIRNDKFTKYGFALTHANMLEELSIISAHAAHGTALANAENKNIEYRISMVCGTTDENFVRWYDKYRI